MDQIEEAIESLPKGAVSFLLSFAPMKTNLQISKQLKEKRPLCILIAPCKFDTPEAFAKAKDDIKYHHRVDNNIILYNGPTPETFLKTTKEGTRYARIFTPTYYDGIDKVLAKNGKIVRL